FRARFLVAVAAFFSARSIRFAGRFFGAIFFHEAFIFFEGGLVEALFFKSFFLFEARLFVVTRFLFKTFAFFPARCARLVVPVALFVGAFARFFVEAVVRNGFQIDRLVADAHVLQRCKYILWHADRQIDRGVVVVNLDAADVRAFNTGFVGNRADDIADTHAVGVADSEAIALRRRRGFTALMTGARRIFGVAALRTCGAIANFLAFTHHRRRVGRARQF